MSTRLLLDTAAFIRINSKGLTGLGKVSRRLLADTDHDLLFSSVSITEIAIKSAIGKLDASATAIRKVAADLQITMIPYTLLHANRLFELPLHHRDPFDRMLIATAQVENCPIVSSDRIFAKYDIKVVW